MKMISRFIESNKIETTAAEVILEAALIHSSDIAMFDETVESFLIVLLFPREGPEFSGALEKIVTTKYADCKDEVVSNNPYDTSQIEESDKSVYASSPFHERTIPIFNKIKKTAALVDEYASDNEFKSKNFADYYIKKLIPFAPLWNVLLKTSDSHFTNASAENYFKIIKISTCENNTGITVGRYVETIQEKTMASYK